MREHASNKDSQADRDPTMRCAQRQTGRIKSERLFSSVTVEHFPQLCLNSSHVGLVLFYGGVKRQDNHVVVIRSVILAVKIKLNCFRTLRFVGFCVCFSFKKMQYINPNTFSVNY